LTPDRHAFAVQCISGIQPHFTQFSPHFFESKTMKFSALCLSLLATLTLSAAAHASPQGEKMKACSTEAKTQGLAGDARKTHMKTCLKGTPEQQAASAAMKAEKKAKMKACNMSAKEKGLKGAERKETVKACLKA
jgi:psiF repeat